MDKGTLRESGSSDSNRATPTGEFDGQSRAAALKALLKKHQDPTEHVPAHRFWARAARVKQVLGLAVVALAIHHNADACTITAKKGEAPVVTNCEQARVSPQAAADVLRPNSFVPSPFCTDCDGPHVYVAPYSGERYESDFLRSARFAGRYDAARGLRQPINGLPLWPFGTYVVGGERGRLHDSARPGQGEHDRRVLPRQR